MRPTPHGKSGALKGQGTSRVCPTCRARGQTSPLTGRHSHIPTSQAPDSPAAEVLHGLRVHGGLPGRVGGPPEKQTTWERQTRLHYRHHLKSWMLTSATSREKGKRIGTRQARRLAPVTTRSSVRRIREVDEVKVPGLEQGKGHRTPQQSTQPGRETRDLALDAFLPRPRRGSTDPLR